MGRHSEKAKLSEALRKGGDRVLAPYSFDEPSVSQLNLGIREFFGLADGSDATGRGQCFYLQHQLVKPKQENSAAPLPRPRLVL